MKIWPLLLVLALALLAGCAEVATIDASHVARAQSSRVKFIVLHYTAGDTAGSLKTLTEEEVSSHYLVSDSVPPVVYRLVDESRQANHAGVSSWKSYANLNPCSIGIEIVNRGFQDTPQGRIWFPFPQPQIDRVIALVKQIAARHAIAPENILGHSDVAPQRKSDPGPLFPWRQLARAGLIPWPDPQRVAAARAGFELQLPDVAWFQQRLGQHGYAVPRDGKLDGETRNVLIAFQMKYRPERFDGTPDAETAALLDVLTSPEGAAP